MPVKDPSGRMKLTDEEKHQLESMAPSLMELDMEIKRAKRAGIDVSALEEEYIKAKRLRDGLLREYS